MRLGEEWHAVVGRISCSDEGLGVKILDELLEHSEVLALDDDEEHLTGRALVHPLAVEEGATYTDLSDEYLTKLLRLVGDDEDRLVGILRLEGINDLAVDEDSDPRIEGYTPVLEDPQP